MMQQQAQPNQTRLYDSIKSAIFVIGTGAVWIIAFRNTLTWYLQKFWGLSGDFWQAIWLKFFYAANGDEWTLGLVYPWLAFVGSFWLFNAFFITVDWLKWPKWVIRYKVQNERDIDLKKYRTAFVRVLFNQFIITFPFNVLQYHLMKWRGCSYGMELPTFQWVAWEIFVFTWVEEIGFYYTHRLAHHPLFYKHVHKIHHEWTAPVGIVSIYCHPIEMAISNLIPVGLGPLLCGSHVATAMLWYILAIFSTTISHCGYHLPFLPSPEAHDFHHLKFNECFGVLGVLDRLHGTDNLFRDSRQYARHFLSLSLVPLTSMYPEAEKVGSSSSDDDDDAPTSSTY